MHLCSKAIIIAVIDCFVPRSDSGGELGDQLGIVFQDEDGIDVINGAVAIHITQAIRQFVGSTQLGIILQNVDGINVVHNTIAVGIAQQTLVGDGQSAQICSLMYS